MTGRPNRSKNPNKKRRKKKVILGIEIAVLAVLCIVLFVSVWAAQKLSLVNHVELDQDKVITAQEANADKTNNDENITEEIAKAVLDPTATVTPAVTKTPEKEEQKDPNLEGVEVIALVGLDTRAAEDGANSDTMIICCIDHTNKTIKLASVYRDTFLNIGEDFYGTPDTFTKCNAAYNLGGPEQFLSMINTNLDLNITEFISVKFDAIAKAIDLVGGLDIYMTKEELVHMNNYNVETSEACGVPYEEIPVPEDPSFDGVIAWPFHLTGTQAVSYSRIRYTEGSDYRRASRQREVLYLLKDKAKQMDLGTLNAMLDAVLPMVTTNIDNGKLLSIIGPILSYDMGNDAQIGFPMVRYEDDEFGTLTGECCVIPVTLEYNVTELHKFLFPQENYTPSATVKANSDYIVGLTGYGEESIAEAATVDYAADVVHITKEMYEAAFGS